jgi:hypothetical protein
MLTTTILKKSPLIENKSEILSTRFLLAICKNYQLNSFRHNRDTAKLKVVHLESKYFD